MNGRFAFDSRFRDGRTFLTRVNLMHNNKLKLLKIKKIPFICLRILKF